MFSQVRGPIWLASLLPGAGLRLLECVEPRMNDINVDHGERRSRTALGAKDPMDRL